MEDLQFSFPLHHGPTPALSVVLICGVLGVPVLLWAFKVVHHQYKQKCSVSAFVILLLINDLLESFLSVYVIVKLFQGDRCEEPTCRILSSIWSGLRVCGVFLQQMMVLETDLGLKYVLCCTPVFLNCFIVITVIGLIFFFKWLFSSSQPFYIFTLLPPLAVTATSCAVNCAMSASKIPSFTGNIVYKYGILTGAALTMILYWLFLIAYVFQGSWGLWVMYLLSLRMIIDPLLCVIISRAKLVNMHRKSDQIF